MAPSSMTLATPFDVSEAFYLMCKIAVDAGLSRREMELAIDAAWRMRAQFEAMPTSELLDAPVGIETGVHS